MAVSTAEFITGPGELWYKPYGNAAVEPADPSVAPAAGWVHLGATNGPVNITIAQSFERVTCEQVVDVLFSLPVDRSFGIEVGLMQPTLDTIKRISNGGTVTAGVNVTTFEPVTDLVGTMPDYAAILVRGMGSGTGKLRDIISRRTLVTDDVEAAYQKGQAQVLRTTWTGHYVSPSIAPFTMRDLETV